MEALKYTHHVQPAVTIYRLGVGLTEDIRSLDFRAGDSRQGRGHTTVGKPVRAGWVRGAGRL